MVPQSMLLLLLCMFGWCQSQQVCPVAEKFGYDLSKGFSAATGKSSAFRVFAGGSDPSTNGFVVRDYTSAVSKSSSTVSTSMQEFSDSFSLSFGIKKLPFKGFLLGGNANYEKASKNFKETETAFYQEDVECIIQKAEIDAEIAPLSSTFKQDVSALVSGRSLTSSGGNIAAYAAFFDKFGTHYIKRAMFGGRVEMTSSVMSCYFSQMSSSQLGACVSARMAASRKLPSGSACVGTGSSEFQSNSASSSNDETRIYGGYPGAYSCEYDPCAIVPRPGEPTCGKAAYCNTINSGNMEMWIDQVAEIWLLFAGAGSPGHTVVNEAKLMYEQYMKNEIGQVATPLPPAIKNCMASVAVRTPWSMVALLANVLLVATLR